jgi:hypothetical protein
VTSCIAGKRSVKRGGVDADQKRLSNGEVGREQAGEQNGSPSMRLLILKPSARPAQARHGCAQRAGAIASPGRAGCVRVVRTQGAQAHLIWRARPSASCCGVKQIVTRTRRTHLAPPIAAGADVRCAESCLCGESGAGGGVPWSGDRPCCQASCAERSLVAFDLHDEVG